MLIVDRDNLRQPFVPTVDTMGSQNQGQECKAGAIKAINHQVTDRIISILLLRVISIAIMIITITIILPKACKMIMNHH
jgi:hypothetical protein